MAYTSFRQTDSRTSTGYKVVGGKIIASDNNYCVEQLKASRLPRVEGLRIFADQTDVTSAVVAELQRYAHYDFRDVPELAFLGQKGK